MHYKNTVYSLMQRLNPFLPIFIFENDKQERETITGNQGKFPALWRLCLQYLCRTSVLGKQSPSKPENPIGTGY